jgi:hypothetical protein
VIYAHQDYPCSGYVATKGDQDNVLNINVQPLNLTMQYEIIDVNDINQGFISHSPIEQIDKANIRIFATDYGKISIIISIKSVNIFLFSF